MPAKPEQITAIATALHDDLKVEWLAPAHCTGEPAFAILKESFGDHYIYAGLGSTLELGPQTISTKAETGRSRTFAMDADDIADYRVGLLSSDDQPSQQLRLANTQP